jgi:hypothetical protein
MWKLLAGLFSWFLFWYIARKVSDTKPVFLQISFSRGKFSLFFRCRRLHLFHILYLIELIDLIYVAWNFTISRLPKEISMWRNAVHFLPLEVKKGLNKYQSPNLLGLGSLGIDSKDSIPPAYVAWRAGTTTLFLLGS